MALTPDDIRILDADPDDLTPMQRGRIRALAMGADRVEVDRRRTARLDAADDATLSAYERGIKRGQAAGAATAYPIITGSLPDSPTD